MFNAVPSTKHSLNLFKLLQTLIQSKNSLTHLQSQTNLLGYLTFGKAQLDKSVAFSSVLEHKHLCTNAKNLHVKY